MLDNQKRSHCYSLRKAPLENGELEITICKIAVLCNVNENFCFGALLMTKDVYCPIVATTHIVQPKWNIQILRAICLYDFGSFNDIRQSLPHVSPN